MKPSNWFKPSKDVPPGYGSGGFLPYGISGVITGAAKAFFAFVGFDSISAAAEEAKNPRRNVPLSILLSLLIVFVAYFALATVLTMMVPYYELVGMLIWIPKFI